MPAATKGDSVDDDEQMGVGMATNDELALAMRAGQLAQSVGWEQLSCSGEAGRQLPDEVVLRTHAGTVLERTQPLVYFSSADIRR